MKRVLVFALLVLGVCLALCCAREESKRAKMQAREALGRVIVLGIINWHKTIINPRTTKMHLSMQK